jgi:hypothetical protein
MCTDVMYFGLKFFPTIVSKAGNRRVPIVGPVVRSLDPILVPTTAEERTVLPPVVDQIFMRLGLKSLSSETISDSVSPRSLPVLIFPEGCVVNQTTVIEFQKGAFIPALPVQPVAISYPFQSHDASWTPDVSMPFMLFRLCSQVYNEMRVTWLPPIPPPPTNDPWLHGYRTQQLIAAQVGVDPCPLSNSDSYLYQGAMKNGFADYAIRHILAQPDAPLGVAGTAGGGFYSRVAQKHTQAGMRDLIRLARQFAEADSEHRGALTAQEFVDHFADNLEVEAVRAVVKSSEDEEAPISSAASSIAIPQQSMRRIPAAIRDRMDARRRRRLAEALFWQLDRDGDGLLRWRELVLGLGISQGSLDSVPVEVGEASEEEEAVAGDDTGPLTGAEAELDAKDAASLMFQAELAFAVIDQDGDGVLSRDDLEWAVAAMRRANDREALKVPQAASVDPPVLRRVPSAIEIRDEIDRLLELSRELRGEDTGHADDDDAAVATDTSAAAVAIDGDAVVASEASSFAAGARRAAPTEGMGLETFKALVVRDTGTRRLVAPAVATVRAGVGLPRGGK